MPSLRLTAQERLRLRRAQGHPFSHPVREQPVRDGVWQDIHLPDRQWTHEARILPGSTREHADLDHD
jgi:hypothetical protein